MQQGNLLNSLLNLNPASVGGKPAAKSRQPEVSPERRQGFQAAMAQARPDQARSDAVESKTRTRAHPPAPAEKNPAAPPQKTERPVSAAVAEKSDADKVQSSVTDDTAGDNQTPEPTTQSLASPQQSEEGDEALQLLLVSLVDNPGAEEVISSSDTTEIPVNMNPLKEGLVDGDTASLLLATHGTAPVSVNAMAALTAVTTSSQGSMALMTHPDVVSTETIPGLSQGELSPEELLQATQGKTPAGSTDTSPLQSLQSGARGNSTILDASAADMADQDLPLMDSTLADASGMDAESQDTPATSLNLKQTLQNVLQKPAEGMPTPQDKNLAAESAKPATPTTLVDAPSRLPDNTLASTRSFMARIHMPQTMGQPQWNQAVGERVLWMAAQNLTAADIRLDPPDLGSMHVKVTLQQDQASVSFVSPNPAVREALDQQATRLREMFAEQGLNLVNVDVSDRHAHERQAAEEQEAGGRRSNQDDDEGLQIIGETSPASLYLVDHYA